jgi:Virulence factor
MATITTIWWRDIPMQVIARQGRQAHKVVLHPRFQVAVDQAAMQAGKQSASDYVEEMRRTARPCADDLEAEATAEAARLETAYDRAVLGRLVAAGGVGAPPSQPAEGHAP